MTVICWYSVLCYGSVVVWYKIQWFPRKWN